MPHRRLLDVVYNCDCFEGLRNLPEGSINLIVTDPPYVVSKSGGGSVNNIKKLDKSLLALDKSKLREGYDIKGFSELVRVLQGGNINAYFWCNKRQIPHYFDVYVGQLKCKFEIISWHKQNALPTYSNKYLSDTEYCLYFHTGGFTHPANYEDAKTYEVGYINHSDKKRFGHPTIKPLDMMRKFIRNSSREGDVVLDPFLGSGTTAVAALLENRHFIGYEVDNDYYKIAIERIKNA